MKVIGLTGSAGSGKDTAAGFGLAWCVANGMNAERVALADPLKVSAARSLGAPAEWSDERCVEFCNELKQPDMTVAVFKGHKGHIDGVSTPLTPHELFTEITGRQYLQFYGTEAHRDVFGETFWTDVTKASINRKEREGVDVVFITDVRFDDEAAFVHAEDDWHGEVWRVYRDSTELGAAAAGHASEGGVLADYVDLLITNDGSLEDLRDAVRLSCESIDWSSE